MKVGRKETPYAPRSSALTLVAVASIGSLGRRPLGVGGLLATSVTTGAGRSTEAHLRPIASRRLGRRTTVVTLLSVLCCCNVVRSVPRTDAGDLIIPLTTILGEVLGRGTREARRLSTLRAVCLVGIERLRVWSLVLAPLVRRLVSVESCREE